MNRLTNAATEWKLVVALFILVLITFSFAQRDSKRLDRLYTLVVEKGVNVADAKKEMPAAITVK